MRLKFVSWLKKAIDFLFLYNNIKIKKVILEEKHCLYSYKKKVNILLLELLVMDTMIYALLCSLYFVTNDTDANADMCTIFLDSSVILYTLYYCTTLISLGVSRNADNLRYPSTVFEYSIGINNYYRKITNLANISIGINVFGIVVFLCTILF